MLDETEANNLSFVTVARGAKYFSTEDGASFFAIGHAEAAHWPQMRPLRTQQDVHSADEYIGMLAGHGVNLLRIMLEDSGDPRWFFEDPLGSPLPQALFYWDNLIRLCEKYHVRLFIAFWDTFHMSKGWKRHPYSRPDSGFEGPWSFCSSQAVRATQKQRIRFFIERWGNSPAIFGYDLLNEINPELGGTPQGQFDWVSDMARFLKAYELDRWGRRHLVTVSGFGLMAPKEYHDIIYRHPELDFATTHVYRFRAIDNPDNTIDCALAMRDAVFAAHAQMPEPRPYMDSEHGPIHRYLDFGEQLDEELDDEYFHNMVWAHTASGAAGSGMRWPFRLPHRLTSGMHTSQRALARFAHAVDWANFAPNPLDSQLQLVPLGQSSTCQSTEAPVICFGCADAAQAVVWLLRDLRKVARDAQLPATRLLIRGLREGYYSATFWDTYAGVPFLQTKFEVASTRARSTKPASLHLPPIQLDLAISVQRLR